ncbi:hypothetical protein H5410_015050 [Solanum commersonii]|uniref:Uncharacterized protein n=1 Tax=Solanum commersonii TaxID=4109 RepID=A0A9J5ZT74_SOLCO|nr:hypothetical protein H5410_015050 [Solanum commersonii]
MDELDGPVFHIREIMHATQAGNAYDGGLGNVEEWFYPRKSDIPLPQPIQPLNQSFSKAFATQGLQEVVEDNLAEELKNLFIEENECNMILGDCTETPTIWDAMPGDALNN